MQIDLDAPRRRERAVDALIARISELEQQLREESARLDWLLQRVCVDEIEGLDMPFGQATIEEARRDFRAAIDAARGGKEHG